MVVFGLLDKIVPRYNLRLNCEIILVGELAITNYHMIIGLGLSREIQSHESNTIHI